VNLNPNIFSVWEDIQIIESSIILSFPACLVAVCLLITAIFLISVERSGFNGTKMD